MKQLKTMILFALLALNAFFNFTTAQAEEHGAGPFVGDEINLTAYDHAFAGQIKDFVAFGWLDEASFSSHLTIRKYALTSSATFKKSENGIGGTLVMGEHQVDIQFLGIDHETKSIKFLVNGAPVIVAVTSEDYVNRHFVNPTYTTELEGKHYSYRLQGEACFGLSLHYNMMILAALSI